MCSDGQNTKLVITSLFHVSSVPFSCSVVSDSLRPHELQQASLSITNSRSLLKHMSIESVMPSSHLILCRPLLLLPPIPPSIRVFSNESALRMRWPKYWSFSFSPSNEHPGLISFRMDCRGGFGQIGNEFFSFNLASPLPSVPSCFYSDKNA